MPERMFKKKKERKPSLLSLYRAITITNTYITQVVKTKIFLLSRKQSAIIYLYPTSS